MAPAPLAGGCVVGTTVFPSGAQCCGSLPLCCGKGLCRGFRINPLSGHLPGPPLRSPVFEHGKSFRPPSSSPSPASSIVF